MKPTSTTIVSAPATSRRADPATAPVFKANRLVSAPGRRGLLEDRGGAAIVEFAMAIMPVFLVFFGMVQWSIVAYVHLIVKHAAYVSARCQAVVNPGMPDSKIGDQDCTDAVNQLFAHVSGVQASDFQITPTLAGPTEQKLDSVTVQLTYKCTIPLGNVIACTSARQQVLTETAGFPNQGSAYQKIWMGS